MNDRRKNVNQIKDISDILIYGNSTVISMVLQIILIAIKEYRGVKDAGQFCF